MKRILFDLVAVQPIEELKFHGGGEYSKTVFIAVCNALEKLRENVTLEVFYNHSHPLDETVKELLRGHEIVGHSVASVEDVQGLLQQKQFDVFFSGLPYDYCDIKIPSNTKFVYTIHGLRQIEKQSDTLMWIYEKKTVRNFVKRIAMTVYPQRWERLFYNRTKRLIDNAHRKCVLTVSEHSKASLLVNFPELNPDDIHVCYSPKKFSFIADEKSEMLIESFGVEQKRYFLLVSCNRWLKNNYRAMIALDELFTTHSNLLDEFKVIALGAPKPEIFNKHLKNPDKFIFKGYVESDELEALYKHAFLFIYPTLNEGFGYPPLEAMKYNTLSACSAVTSIPEACGDAVFYFNPYDIMEIKNRVIESFNFSIREEKERKMVEQFSKIDKAQQQALETIIGIILDCHE